LDYIAFKIAPLTNYSWLPRLELVIIEEFLAREWKPPVISQAAVRKRERERRREQTIRLRVAREEAKIDHLLGD
jgi:hypothetical protein